MFSSLKARLKGSFLDDLAAAYSENDIPTRAAALSLYSIMSIFPFIAILVWITTLSGSPREAHLWSARLSVFLPPDFAELVNNEIEYRLSLSENTSSLLLIFHTLLLLFSAGAALRSLLFGFREIAEADDTIGIAGVVLRSFLFVIPEVFFVFIASMVVAVLSYVSITLTSALQSTWLISPLLWTLMTAILVGMLNGVYASSLIGHQILPIHGWLGSAIAAALISVVTIGLTTYFQINPVNRDWYGSPGFIINVLLWFYACASCLLLGAQINAVKNARARRGSAATPAQNTAQQITNHLS